MKDKLFGIKTGLYRPEWVIPALIIAILMIVHSLAFTWLDNTLGIAGRAFCMTYICAAALYWGVPGGGLASLVTVPLNILLSRSAGLEVLPAGLLGALGIVLGGGFIGRLSDLNMQLKEQLGKRVEVEKELRSYQQHLQSLVGERTSDLTTANKNLQREIGERKRIEKALRESEKRFRELADFLPQTVFEIDAKGDLVFVNRAGVETFGYTLEALEENLNAFQMIAPEDRGRCRSNMERVLAGDHQGGNEYRALRKDGTTFSSIVYSNPIVQEGQPAGLRGILVDITERKRLEADLLRSQKMESVGRLAGGVAHDFNNMLTTIAGYCELGMMKIEPNHPLYPDLQEILKASERATKLTRQLLAFSRRQITEPKVLNLNDILLDMDHMLRRLIGEDVELVTLPSPQIGPVRVDPGQIEQLIVNLAVNARDAMPGGGKLTLVTANVSLDSIPAAQNGVISKGDYVMLTFSDTGVGMTEEVKGCIFEPFFTTKKESKGTGLGLPTCYGIVKQSGGFIFVSSEINRGTTFKIYLPRVEQQVDTRRKRYESGDLACGTETILLVEDEPSVRAITARILRQQGYKVLEASTGEQALRVARRQDGGKIHLLLTDVVMPELGGRELADRLTTEYVDLKVLFLSGYPGDAQLGHGVLDPGLSLLQKPFSPLQLSQKVRESLDHTSNIRSLA